MDRYTTPVFEKDLARSVGKRCVGRRYLLARCSKKSFTRPQGDTVASKKEF